MMGTLLRLMTTTVVAFVVVGLGIAAYNRTGGAVDRAIGRAWSYRGVSATATPAPTPDGPYGYAAGVTIAEPTTAQGDLSRSDRTATRGDRTSTPVDRPALSTPTPARTVATAAVPPAIADQTVVPLLYPRPASLTGSALLRECEWASWTMKLDAQLDRNSAESHRS